MKEVNEGRADSLLVLCACAMSAYTVWSWKQLWADSASPVLVPQPVFQRQMGDTIPVFNGCTRETYVFSQLKFSFCGCSVWCHPDAEGVEFYQDFPPAHSSVSQGTSAWCHSENFVMLGLYPLRYLKSDYWKLVQHYPVAESKLISRNSGRRKHEGKEIQWFLLVQNT